MRLAPRLALAAAALFAFAGAARADDLRIVIHDHRFEPSRLEVPAGQKFKLIVKNDDKTAEELDSDDLHREKVVAAGAEATVFLGPLAKGEYRFAGEYHEDTAKGVLVAK